jgi:hypothetical protein
MEHDPLIELRRWTVGVVLVLFFLGFGAEVLDAWFFGDRLRLDAGFYGVIGGVLIGGLFGAGAMAILRSRRDGNE